MIHRHSPTLQFRCHRFPNRQRQAGPLPSNARHPLMALHQKIRSPRPAGVLRRDFEAPIAQILDRLIPSHQVAAPSLKMHAAGLMVQAPPRPLWSSTLEPADFQTPKRTDPLYSLPPSSTSQLQRCVEPDPHSALRRQRGRMVGLQPYADSRVAFITTCHAS